MFQSHPPRAGGFTLAETLVAMALVMMALLLGLSLFWQQPKILERLQAHEEALVALEVTLESLRAGVLPLISGAVEWPLPSSGPAGQTTGRQLLIEVLPTETPGLFAVSLQVRYRFQEQVRVRTIETMVWNPG